MRRPRPPFALALPALLLALGAGCTVSRVRVNPHLAGLDATWIAPGRTTRAEVIERLGMPPPVGRVENAPAYVSDDTLRWLATDTRIWELRVGYIVTPIFRHARTVAADDLLVRFDARGVVRGLSRVRRRGGRVEVLDFRGALP